MGQRIVDTRNRLGLDVDAWVATSGPDRPWLIPLSFLWYHDRLLFATGANSPTVENIARVPRVRVALDGVRDVVIIDGRAALASSTTLSSHEIQAYVNKHGSDPRTWADTVIGLTPLRIQAWREENEIAGRTIMRDGAWVSGPS
jgi:nitroimidazol reductase NimA-like FMN-containing flavoprotein (pyridoxamine 5'-phosphate oxidase superfamily)